jgi:predicted DNA-binding protein with PD1-like motif
MHDGLLEMRREKDGHVEASSWKPLFCKAFGFGSETIEEIAAVAIKSGADNAIFTCIGVLSSAVLGFYDQAGHQYMTRSFEGPSELVSCSGNVTRKEEKPFVHAHAVLSNDSFAPVAGHLVKGTVFAAELQLTAVQGELIERRFDPATGLHLWEESGEL